MHSGRGLCDLLIWTCIKLNLKNYVWLKLILVIFGTQIEYGPQMCPIVSGNDVMHNNEWWGFKNLEIVIFQQPCVCLFFIVGLAVCGFAKISLSQNLQESIWFF